MSRLFKITYFNRLYDPQGQLYELTLKELVDMVCVNYEVIYKDQAPGVIYGTLEGNSRGSGTKVLTRSCIAVDYDHIKNLDEWFSCFTSMMKDYVYIMYTSFSHKMGEHGEDIGGSRVRVIIPLSRDISVEQYEAFVNDIFCYSGSKILLGAVDKTSYQAKRFMFCHSSPVGGKGFTYVNGLEGENLLDISWYPVPDKLVGETRDDEYEQITCEYADFNEAVKAFNEKYPGDTIYKSIKDEEYIDFINKVNIEWFIQTRLSNVYVDRYKNRYRYVHSESGVNGAIVYNNVLYSNHDSDPAGNGHTHGVFSLLKIHLCGGDYVPAINYVKRLLNYRFYE